MPTPDIDSIRKYVAYGSVGSSTLRNIGAAGAVASAKRSLSQIQLAHYAPQDADSFARQLNSDTEAIRKALPDGAKHFGAARKVLNIFLRGALYNTYLLKHYNLNANVECYEIPLDKLSATGILKHTEANDRIRWIGVKHVTPKVNDDFQRLATKVAERLGTLRVHLDAVFWGGRDPDA